MANTRMSTRGRITIPATVRAALSLSAGSRVEFLRLADGQFAIAAAGLEVQLLKGAINRSAPSVSVESMHKAISERGARQES